MTTKLTEMDKAISEYKQLHSKLVKIETKKENLRVAIKLLLGDKDVYIGERGKATKISFVSRHTNFTAAKAMLDEDVYFQIVTETPAESIRIS